MPSEMLRVENRDGVAILTLNRPEALNALCAELRGALSDTFRALECDAQTRVVVLTGAGRAFCAGLDLKELSASEPGEGAFAASMDPTRAMADFSGPIIGAINGHAITGGFELALACDVLIASHDAVFADTHARVGILPGWGLSQKLSRIVGIGRAKEISLTGNFFPAQQMADWGLVNRVVAPEQLLPSCQALAADMLSCVPGVMRDYKKLIDEGYAMTFDDAMAHEARCATASMRALQSGALGERRESVQSRGRTQNSD